MLSGTDRAPCRDFSFSCYISHSLLAVDPVFGRTRLAWLGTGPVSASPAAVKDELEKLAFLRGMDAHTLDLSALPAERRRFLAGVGQRLTRSTSPGVRRPAGTRSC